MLEPMEEVFTKPALKLSTLKNQKKDIYTLQIRK
jgi:hypothetical protein